MNAAVEAPGPFHPASAADYLPPDVLRALQSERLRAVVGRVFDGVPLVRQRMQKHGLSPGDVRGVEDIAKLPLVSRADVAGAYPTGMFATEPARIAKLAALPGGREPIVTAFTRADLAVAAELLVRALAACGVGRGDVVLTACGHDGAGDGPALEAALDALLATAVPVAGGDPDRHLVVLRDFGVSAVISTPGYFLHLVQRADAVGTNLGDLALRLGVFVAGPWTGALRRRIEEAAGIRAFDLFGLPELFGTGIGAECRGQDGLHLFEDHFFPEIVDPETGQPVPDGEEGELVLTTLTREAMPLVRYRTRDLAATVPEPCSCGRTLRRVRRVARRADEVLVIQGVEVYPSEIEAALLAVEGAVPNYRIVLEQEAGLDRAEVQIEVTPEIFSDQVAALERIETKLAGEIEHAVGLHVPVRLVEPHTIQQGGPTSGRVVDRRGT